MEIGISTISKGREGAPSWEKERKGSPLQLVGMLSGKTQIIDGRTVNSKSDEPREGKETP